MFIAYELGHVDDACKHAQNGATVVALDFLVGLELKKRNIPFIGARDFCNTGNSEEYWWLIAQNVAREWYRLPAMKFFEYENIRIGESLEPMMEAYLSKLFYYAMIYTELKKAYPEKNLHIPAPIKNDVPTAGPLAVFERFAVIDAARGVGLENAIHAERKLPHGRIFSRNMWKSLIIHAYNAVISLAPRLPAQAGHGLKIYASEYWSQIAPVVELMDEAELVLMESSELKKIPWRKIFKHRIRIRHPADDADKSARNKAMARAGEYVRLWNIAKKDIAGYLSAAHDKFDWSPVLEACEYLMAYSARIVADIDALNRIIKEEKPKIVLQRASIGGRQHHFFLMARVASRLNVPTIELQHAVAYIDPRSVHSRIETDILASYGRYIAERYANIGYERKKILSIGSPRFDRCFNSRRIAFEKGKKLLKQFGLNAGRPVLLAAVPFSDSVLSAVTVDSYELAEFFKNMRSLQETIPGLQVLLKFRSYGEAKPFRDFINSIFQSDTAIAGNADLFALLCASDAALCGNSTVIYETLLAEKPLVLYPWKKWDSHMKNAYAPAAPVPENVAELKDALRLIFTDRRYRGQLIARGKSFLKGYAFDGKSARRMAALLRQSNS
ncbi:CDP-glycerol glycerophosphotransferase family protein [Candidatus Kaiserbacteria bacterium]|nr:CDP-glycerol glycerophosphotransferase family protein [Candidatus Kaiserbacteria bacterium]